jgi:hypothetical protein
MGGIGGAGGVAGTGGRGGTGGSNVDAGPCFDARPNCQSSDAGVCDPYCQTRCLCHEKCTIGSTGPLACVSAPSSGYAGLGQGCTLTISTAAQSDLCAPGQVCMVDECSGGSGNGRCFAFCRNDADCPNSQCTRSLNGQMLCDVPFVACNPVVGQPTGCPGTALGCYLSSSVLDQTLCDCPFNSTMGGGQGFGNPCTSSRQCTPGLACIDVNGTNNLTCRQTCRLGVDGGASTGCTTGGTCRPYHIGGNTQLSTVFGYCGA